MPKPKDNVVKYRDAETGRTRTGRIVVKPGREADANAQRAMGDIVAHAAWQGYQDSPSAPREQA